MLLRSKDKETLCAIFSELDMPLEIWAYGSRVSGEAHEGSDLDLVIRTSSLQKLPLEVFLKLKDKVQQSKIPIVVELFDWARLPDSFCKSIEAQHEVLFSNMEMMVNEPPEKYGKNHDPIKPKDN